MKGLKILPLEKWMKYPDIKIFPNLETDVPYIGRDGFYMLYDTCWFEFNNILYIMKDCHSFKSILELLNIPPSIRKCEIDAMIQLRKAGLLDKKLIKLLSNIELRKELRDISISVKKLKLKLK